MSEQRTTENARPYATAEQARWVRVVEGERDAARAALEPFRTANLVVRKCENGKHGPSASDFDASADCQRCRAESAEAAHAALVAAVEALAKSWADEAEAGRTGNGNGHALLVQTYDGHARDLRALLAGGAR